MGSNYTGIDFRSSLGQLKCWTSRSYCAASVKECHDKKVQIVPWTVNTKEEIKQLTDLGVDGIISDYPDLY